MTYGKSDGRFLLYGVKPQDKCFYFLSYHFLSCQTTVRTSAKNDHFYAQYADSKISPIWPYGFSAAYGLTSPPPHTPTNSYILGNVKMYSVLVVVLVVYVTLYHSEQSILQLCFIKIYYALQVQLKRNNLLFSSIFVLKH